MPMMTRRAAFAAPLALASLPAAAAPAPSEVARLYAIRGAALSRFLATPEKTPGFRAAEDALAAAESALFSAPSQDARDMALKIKVAAEYDMYQQEACDGLLADAKAVLA